MKKTLEQLINDLGMTDYHLFIEKKTLEHESELQDLDNELYQKARKNYDTNLRKSKDSSLEVESSVNWKEWFEYQHMYESGFKDALKFIHNSIALLQSLDEIS